MIKDFNDLLSSLRNDMPTILYYEGEIGSILLQYFDRNIEGKKIRLFGIWIIDIFPKYQNKGYFTKLVKELEDSSYNVCVNDIVSPIVEAFLWKRGRTFDLIPKNDGDVKIAYMLKK